MFKRRPCIAGTPLLTGAHVIRGVLAASPSFMTGKSNWRKQGAWRIPAVFRQAWQGDTPWRCSNWHATASSSIRSPRASPRSEEHTSELQSLMRISYAVFCLKKKKNQHTIHTENHTQYTHDTHQ